jgi:hypothetical protein
MEQEGTKSNMEVTETKKDSTAAWSPANRRFREFAEHDAGCRSRETFNSIFCDNPLKVMSPQPWPLFIERGAVSELERVSLGLDRLVKSVPERFFGNDPTLLASFYGSATPEVAELVIAEPNGVEGAISRGDFLEGPEGLQCLEINSGSYIGGWQLQALEDLYLNCPVIARFLAAEGLRASHRNTIRLMFRHIIRETLRMGLVKDGILNLAMIIHPHYPIQVAIHSSERYNREYRAALAEERPGLDGEVILCGYADLTDERRGLSFQGERVHAVLDQHNGQHDSRGFRHFKAGTVNLYSGPITRLLSDKRNLALLSENATSHDLTAEERELLERHLPWTRLVRDTTTSYRGRRVRLPELLAESRERFVLKKASSLGGKDVHLGRSRSQAEWEALLREALADPGWIAQELVEVRPALFLDVDDRVVPHDLVWGLFAFGDTFGGAFLRLQPCDRGGVVNTAGGAEVGLLLEIEPQGGPL